MACTVVLFWLQLADKLAPAFFFPLLMSETVLQLKKDIKFRSVQLATAESIVRGGH